MKTLTQTTIQSVRETTLRTTPRRRRRATQQQQALAEALEAVQAAPRDARAVRRLQAALAPILGKEAHRLARETGESLRDCEADLLSAAWEAAMAYDATRGVFPAHYFGSRYGKVPSARITAARRHARWCERHHFVDAADLDALAGDD